MILQEQLGKPQRPNLPVELPTRLDRAGSSLLGDELGQSPLLQVFGDAYLRVFNGAWAASKLALLKAQKFTPEGKEHRITESITALNAVQVTELSLAQWKEIVEEVEDVED